MALVRIEQLPSIKPDPRAAGSDKIDFETCPNCGGTETLEDLEAVLEDLMIVERTANRSRSRSRSTANLLDITPKRLVPAEHRTCTGCGTTWHTKAKQIAQEIKRQAWASYEQQHSVVDRLAHLEDPEWQAMLKKIAE